MGDGSGLALRPRRRAGASATARVPIEHEIVGLVRLVGSPDSGCIVFQVLLVARHLRVDPHPAGDLQARSVCSSRGGGRAGVSMSGGRRRRRQAPLTAVGTTPAGSGPQRRQPRSPTQWALPHLFQGPHLSACPDDHCGTNGSQTHPKDAAGIPGPGRRAAPETRSAACCCELLAPAPLFKMLCARSLARKVAQCRRWTRGSFC